MIEKCVIDTTNKLCIIFSFFFYIISNFLFEILKCMVLRQDLQFYSTVFHTTTHLHFRDRINVEYMCNIKITLTLEMVGARIQSEKQPAHLYSAHIPTRYTCPVISRKKSGVFLDKDSRV